jgi:hypothetical protein
MLPLAPLPAPITHSSVNHLSFSLSRQIVCLPTNPQHFTGPHRTSSNIQLFNQSIPPRHALLVSALPHISTCVSSSSVVAEKDLFFCLACWQAGRQAGVTPTTEPTSESHYVTFPSEKENNHLQKVGLRLLQNNLASVGYTNWVRPVTTLRLHLAMS